MDYEKKLALAKEALDSGSYDKETIEYIFPELRKSEDEKIEKGLIQYFKNFTLKTFAGLDPKKILAWLEKQGEQKHTDKVEPKFKVGNWYQCTKDFFGKGVTFDKNTAYYCAKEGCLQNKYGCNIAIVKDLYDNFKLWTIQDAKAGDVLQLGFVTAIFKKHLDDCICECYISIYDNELNVPKTYETYGSHNAVPATKEQRDLLFQKMKESGYEWDAEELEVKKIEKKPIEDVDLPEFDSHLCLMFQKFRTKGICTNGEIIDYVKEHSQKLKDILVKPTWSEEGEKKINFLIALLQDSTVHNHALRIVNEELENWLKSLKDRVQPMVEWEHENTGDLTDFENAMMHIGESFFSKNAGLNPNDTNTIKEQANILAELVQSKEWNEEDKWKINRIYYILGQAADTHAFSTTCRLISDKECVELQDFLKSLRPQNLWKPSDEQLNTLLDAIVYVEGCNSNFKGSGSVLEKLYNDLKKLKG